MTQPKNAFWRCLYTTGHDAALVVPLAGGWLLKGTAVFGVPEGITAVNYEVEADDAWVAKRGAIQGFRGDTQFYHAIERTPDGWMLDGRPNGLADLKDLDFGFTPATNFQQVSRAKLKVGERAEFSVAWFDIGKHELLDLPQIYETSRRDTLLVPVAAGRLRGHSGDGCARVHSGLSGVVADGAAAVSAS